MSKLTNPIVRAAMEALGSGDRAAWYALFEPHAELFDAGSPWNLEEFTNHAVGYERLLSIAHVKNDGLDVVGEIYSEFWGSFRTYFHFRISPAGRIARLDVGHTI
ncbi:hypothetical protein LZC95_51810 [Pendulispora brunnea]|uniref:SnoaL-like domain-containing protein n=1 Tax=Pendulispora brunnea TaxID=2905690 RepID=A0ABZ2KC36_9BACT